MFHRLSIYFCFLSQGTGEKGIPRLCVLQFICLSFTPSIGTQDNIAYVVSIRWVLLDTTMFLSWDITVINLRRYFFYLV